MVLQITANRGIKRMIGQDNILTNAINKIAEGKEEELTMSETMAIPGEVQILATYQGQDRVISNKEYWKEKGSHEENILTMTSGISSLDTYTQGFQVGEVWVISGPTKHGKTTLCETIGHEIFLEGQKCLWFFYEMPEQFLRRHKDVDDVVYIPRENRSEDLEWIRQRVLEAKLRFNIKAVFIDHLHYVVGFQNLMKNASISIGRTMRFLKNEIAVKYGVAVFLVSHMTKTDFTQEPSENDLRDSSFISQEADGTIIVYRRLKEGKQWGDEDPFSTKSKLILCNARRSGAMRAKVNLVKLGNYLHEEEMEAFR
jgi:replicative DNA helicase